ncbi:MAG TPA: hypothetical protein VFP10_11590, partial [Candidatus Eisenbacteria bacterium]|nr:hypothetical protein [Candidatus Eisenbacteria bacterium]
MNSGSSSTRIAFLGILALLASLCGCSKQPAVANARETMLTPGPGVRLTPVPSPDGRWLAYTAKDEMTDLRTVYVMPINGGEGKRFLPSVLRIGALGWTPDSQHLLAFFITPEGTRKRVYSVSGELLRDLPAIPQATPLSISEDGRQYIWCKLNGD